MEQPEKDINEEVVDIAGAIVRLADLGDALQASRLKQRALILLLHDITKVRKNDIMYVLNALPSLRDYVRK
jgi:hypothetical protein